MTIDKKLVFKVFDLKSWQEIFSFSLLEMSGFPVSMAYFDPFNFKYIYKLRAWDDLVAFTCDLGTLVFRCKDIIP